MLRAPLGEGLFTQYLLQVFEELGKRTGLGFEIAELPKKRALFEANYGQHIDGVTARIGGLDKLDLTNLVVVDQPIVQVEHVVFARRQGIIQAVKDRESLVRSAIEQSFAVGFLRGSKKAEMLVAGVPEKLLYRFNNQDDAFLRLSRDRLGVFIGGPGMVSRNLLNEKYQSYGIVEVSTLSKTPLFPYLHKKHTALVPRLKQALQTMEEDGTLAVFRRAIQSGDSFDSR